MFYKDKAVQTSMLSCYHQPRHARCPISDSLPGQAVSCSWSDLKSHHICCKWKKETVVFHVLTVGRGGLRSCVHAALNIHIGASYLFISSRQVFEWHVAATGPVKRWCMTSPGKYWKTSAQTGMQPAVQLPATTYAPVAMHVNQWNKQLTMN